MADWLSHVAIAAPRNGTTSHTVTPSAGTVVAGASFTPTAGRFLLLVIEGSVTSTAPDYTAPPGGSAVNNTGLYVFYKASAAGGDSVTSVHNASNYPVVFHFFEFAPGSTFAGVASSTAVFSGGAGPVLNSLTGTNWTAGVFGTAAVNTSSTSGSVAWSGGTELADTLAAYGATDGYLYSLTATDADTATSRSYAATVTGDFPAAERLVFAVTVAAMQSEGSRNSSAMSRMRG